MSQKQTIANSNKYWNKQIERLISWEIQSKTPIDILLKAIDTKISHNDEYLFQLSLI